MQSSAQDIKAFYDSEIGALVAEMIGEHMRELWPDVHGMRVMGCGYALPYLPMFEADKPERVIAMMPERQGALRWPEEGKNLAMLCDDERMPIEHAFVDRVVLVHYLEGAADVQASLREVWRILKANGRVIVVVPNRMGAWTHADWSPFGRGMPYTLSQLCHVMQDGLFTHERHVSGLFMLPIPKSPVMMRAARMMERMGKSFMPFVAGVHIVEFSKQIYARAGEGGSGTAVVTKAKEVLAGGKVEPARRAG